MNSKKQKQAGFAPLEAVLIIVFIGIIGFVGWFVYNSKHTTEKTLRQANAVLQSATSAKPKTTTNNAATPTTTLSSSANDNASLNSDLTSINSSQGQENQDANSATSGIDDQQNQITVPTN